MNQVLPKSDDFNTKYRPKPKANNTALRQNVPFILCQVYRFLPASKEHVILR